MGRDPLALRIRPKRIGEICVKTQSQSYMAVVGRVSSVPFPLLLSTWSEAYFAADLSLLLVAITPQMI
jgi:hypothetical protein